jgi:Ca2+-binding EF-hand superfamily protein
MVDATPLPTSSTPTAASRTATANKLFQILDPNNTGKIQKSDFLELYSMLGNGGARSGPQTDSFGITQTTYSVQETSYNIASENYVSPDRFLETSSAAVVHAANVFTSLDTDKSGTLSRAEFMVGLGAGPSTAPADPSATSTDPSPKPSADPSSQTTASSGTATNATSSAGTTPSASDALVADATSQADQALALFDPTGKGYFDANDVAAAFTKSPSLGDPATAAQTVSAWDDNGDGKVTRDELISGYTTMNLADALMNQLDPTGQGYIDTSSLSSVALPSFPNASTIIAGWDTNKDGQVSRQEVIDGFHALNAKASSNTATSDATAQDPAALFAHYDANKDGSLDLLEITSAAGSSAATDPAQTLAAWDTNGDGAVSQQEFTDGFNLIKQATGIIAQYDTAGKGYFDQADLQAAIDFDPTSNNGTSASDLMKFWDSNGDGKVTVPEVLAGLANGGTAAATPVASATPDPSTSNSVPDVSNLLSAYGYSAAPVTPALTDASSAASAPTVSA